MSAHALAGTATYANFSRQIQQESGVIWDMPVMPSASAPCQRSGDKGSSIYQQWSIEQSEAKEYLRDEKLVRAYLPQTSIRIETLDRDAPFPRTRVDQPFSVRIEVADLLTGVGLPDSSTKVLFVQSLRSGHTGKNPPAGSCAPLAAGYIATNGTTVLKFPASSLKANDVTTARGEEHFVIHTLADGSSPQSEIASAFLQVWPVASGALCGITPGEKIHGQIPAIHLDLHDLYPRSVTYLMLYKGTEVNGVSGTEITSLSIDQDGSESRVLQIKDWTDKITEDGTYTVALMSETIYGKELLCDPVTFSFNSTHFADSPGD